MEQAVIPADGQAARENSDYSPAQRRKRPVTLFYDPPYENELDDSIARLLVAYLVPSASLDYKTSVLAPHTRCRFDFLIDLGKRRIAIDYTDTPENLETALVEDNDALALGAGLVDIVVRIRRHDLEERLYDCFHVIAKWEPNLFTPYGQRVFASRASEQARDVLPEPEAGVASVYYANCGDESEFVTIEDVLSGEAFEWPDLEEDDSLVIRRMSRDQPDYWQRQYERAALVYGRGPIRRVKRV